PVDGRGGRLPHRRRPVGSHAGVAGRDPDRGHHRLLRRPVLRRRSLPPAVVGVNGLQFDAVSVAYDGRTVLGPVTARVEPGSWLALIGPNGAGKTSLLHAAAGLVPHGGTVRIGGRPLDGMAPLARARLVALVPQRPTVPED